MRSLAALLRLLSAPALALVAGSSVAAQEDAPAGGDGAPPVDGAAADDAEADPDPDPPRGLRLRAPAAFDGYTLFAPITSGTTYLVDLDGEVVHAWRSEHAPGASVYLLPSGHLLRCARLEDNPTFHGGGIGGRLQELAPDSTVVWEYDLSTPERIHHHDVEPLPNGNVLLIAWEAMTSDEARAAGRDPRAVGDAGLWPDAVVEVEPVRPRGGRVVWEWRARDHLVQDLDRRKAGYGDVPAHPGRIDVNADHRAERALTAAERRKREEEERRMRALGYVGGDDEAEPDDRARRPDWLHTNSVDHHPELDLVLLSTPRMNEIWVIDHSTTTDEARGRTGGRWGRGGELLWRWGNPRAYGAGTEADQRLFAQHDAQWIPPGHPGAGNVLVFNNGNRRPGGDHSSVDELVPPFDPERGFVREPGRPYGPAEPAWSYTAPEADDFYSFFISGCQRLPNGNTLVCSGAQGRFFEVTPDKEIVWEYWNPFGGDIPPSFGHANPGPTPELDPHAVFRCTRLAPDHPGIAPLLGA